MPLQGPRHPGKRPVIMNETTDSVEVAQHSDKIRDCLRNNGIAHG